MKLTSDELRDAAERFENSGGFACSDPEECIDDLHLLAGAYVAEHPSDDAEVVTEEWCKSCMRFRGAGAGGPVYESRKSCGICVDVNFSVGSNFPTLWVRADFSGEKSIRIVKDRITRGCVRRLTSALGVQLNEKR